MPMVCANFLDIPASYKGVIAHTNRYSICTTLGLNANVIYLKFCQGEALSCSDFGVVPEGRASDDGP